MPKYFLLAIEVKVRDVFRCTVLYIVINDIVINDYIVIMMSVEGPHKD